MLGSCLLMSIARNLSNSSRPRTPPSSSSAKIRIQEASPPPKTTPGKNGSPPYKSYINFLSNTNDDWKADEDDMMGYEDDDGDDFGLPSLSSMKRRTRRIATQNKAESSTLSPTTEGPPNALSARRYSNSADIAIERPAPTYPMPKKSEGKILRPQYKEILKGLLITLQSAVAKVLTMTVRPRQRSASHQLSHGSCQCQSQGRRCHKLPNYTY